MHKKSEYPYFYGKTKKSKMIVKKWEKTKKNIREIQ